MNGPKIPGQVTCVYHLMCAIDLALQKYCHSIRAQYLPTKDWKWILDKIFSKINTYSTRTKRQVIKKEQHLSAYTHLNAIRAAWRNPTMHSRRRYTVAQADDIFQATRAFMRDLTKVV